MRPSLQLSKSISVWVSSRKGSAALWLCQVLFSWLRREKGESLDYGLYIYGSGRNTSANKIKAAASSRRKQSVLEVILALITKPWTSKSATAQHMRKAINPNEFRQG